MASIYNGHKFSRACHLCKIPQMDDGSPSQATADGYSGDSVCHVQALVVFFLCSTWLNFLLTQSGGIA